MYPILEKKNYIQYENCFVRLIDKEYNNKLFFIDIKNAF